MDGLFLKQSPAEGNEETEMTAGELKKKLLNGQQVYGTMVSAFDTPEISRILKNAGFSWFFYDGEHGYPNADRLYGIFAYARFCGIPALMRIPEINKTEVFRALDSGADGIVCPNVETSEQAQELVRLAKYDPLGERGVSFTRPHTGYRKVNALEYMESANLDTILICQMESPRGLSNLDEILGIEGVDGILVGPNDLTASMGIINQLQHPDYLAAVERAFQLCREHGKIAGISGKDLNVLRGWGEKGATLLQWGTDVSLLMAMIRSGGFAT